MTFDDGILCTGPEIMSGKAVLPGRKVRGRLRGGVTHRCLSRGVEDGIRMTFIEGEDGIRCRHNTDTSRTFLGEVTQGQAKGHIKVIARSDIIISPVIKGDV